MTFAPEWLTGNANLDGSTFKFFWIYLVFMNGVVWVWIPLVLLIDSGKKTVAAFAVSGIDTTDVAAESVRQQVKRRANEEIRFGGGAHALLFVSVALILAAYCVLVPGVIATAGAPVTGAAA